MEIINKKLEAHRQYNHEHKDIINEKSKKYYKLNKNVIVKQNKIYRDNNSNKIRIIYNKWRMKNKDKIALKNRKYYEQNKDIFSIKSANYYQENKELIKERTKNYRIAHRPAYLKACSDYYYKHKVRLRKLQYEYKKLRCAEDKTFRLVCLLRKRIWDALNRYKEGGKRKSNQLYGIDVNNIAKKLINELPEDFEFGKYHVDHIIPIACFDLNDPKQLKECFKPENHQWLLAQDNLDKSDKILPEHENLYLKLKTRFKLKK